MLYDTDALIWFKRGNSAVADIIDRDFARSISLQTYLELVQGAKDKRQLKFARRFLADFDFKTIPLDESIGNRAAVLVESYALSHGMRAGDALIAATALERNLAVCTANVRHFRQIPALTIVSFPIDCTSP